MSLVRFLRDERGQVMVLGGAALALFVGLGAFTVDLSNAYSVQGRLQNAADAAALAAAQRLSNEQSAEWEEATRRLALQFVERNINRTDGTVARAADVTFGQYSVEARQFTAGVRPFNAVRVKAQRTDETGNAVKTYFGGIFGVGQIDVAAQAIAMKGVPGTCLYALDPDASAALQILGAASISAPHCGVQVNSSAADAAVTTGNGSLEATAINVVGDVSGKGFSPAPNTRVAPLPDPLADLPEPPQPGPCFMTDVNINKSQVLQANRTYCGSISFSGNAEIELEPGIYYFKDAEVQISSASFIGKDVLIFLDANSSIHFSGNGHHEISAAETGTYAGIVIYQSREAKNPVNRKSGNSTLALSGAIYMPSSTLQVTGTGGVNARPGNVKAEVEAEPGESEAGGESEGGNKGQGQNQTKQVHVTEIEYVIARQFHLAGNANFRIGRRDGSASANARAVLVH